MRKAISCTSVCLQTSFLALCIVIAFAGAVSAQPIVQQPPGGTTWYVDGAAVASGDGTAPAKAVKTNLEGLALAGGGADMHFAIALPPGVELPTTLTFPVEASRSVGKLNRTLRVIYGGTPLYLPEVMR
jgi:hypothetical protein